MRRTKKRVFALLLSLCMVFTMLPIPAMAADTDISPTAEQLTALGYSIESGYQVVIDSGGSLWLNGAECSASTTINMLKFDKDKNGKLYAAFFSETALSVGDNEKIAKLGAPGGNNPNAESLKVQSSYNSSSLHFASPQSLDELKVDAEGRIYYMFHPHIAVDKTPVKFYLGANGLTANAGDASALQTVTFTVEAAAGGTVSVTGADSGSSNTYTAAPGASVTLTATPNSGFAFTQWSDGDKNNPRTITAVNGASYTAGFASNQYTVKLTAGANSTISSGNGVQSVTKGSAIADITVTPAKGFVLPAYNNSAWTAVLNGTGLAAAAAADGAIVISGTPGKDVTVTLPAAIGNTWSVKVTASANAKFTVANGDQTIDKGKSITDITLTPDAGYTLPGEDDAAWQSLKNAGLTISKDANTGVVTISGIPTASVTLDSLTAVPAPAPTVKVTDITASGTGLSQRVTATVEVESHQPGFTYEYSIDGGSFVSVSNFDSTANTFEVSGLRYGDHIKVRVAGMTNASMVRIMDSALRNGGFETVIGASSADLISGTNVYAWRTTASDGKIEIAVPSQWYGLSSVEGRYCAELNAHESASLYQEVATTPNAEFTWSLRHAGRNGTDTMALIIGPATEDSYKKTSASSKDIFQNIVDTMTDKTPNTPHAVAYDGKTYTVTIIQGNARTWRLSTNTYKIPEGQTETVFAFTSLNATSPDVGNLLDGISFEKAPITLTSGVDRADGRGKIEISSPAADGKYSLLKSDGSPMSKAELDALNITAVDGEGNKLLADENGAFHWSGNIEAPLALSVPAGDQYIVEVEYADGEKKTKSTIIPAATENQLSAEVVEEEGGKSISLTVSPADPDLFYGLVDKDGKAVDAGAWKESVDGKVVFEGLNADEEYQIVAKPKNDSSTTTDQKASTGTSLKTPADQLKNVTVDDIRRQNGETIVIDPTTAGQEYGVYDPETGLTEWKTSDGNKLIFDGLDPNKDYEVVTRTPGKPASVPAPGVNVPSGAIDGSQIAGGVDETNKGKTTITFPTEEDKSYVVVDKNGTRVWPADGWHDGDGSSVTVSGLTPGEGYRVVAVDSSKKDSTDLNNTAGTSIIAMPLPAVSPNENGGYKSEPAQNGEIRRENGYAAPYTDSITVKAEDGYSYAVRGEDGKYYPADSGVGQTTPAWQSGAAGSDLTFSNLPNGQKYEVVKIPTAAENDFDSATVTVIPAETEVPIVTNMSDGAVDGTIDGKSGDGLVTVRNTDSKYQYILLDGDGKAVDATEALRNPQTGNGSTITFKPTMPGQKYSVVAVPSDLNAQDAVKAAEARRDAGISVTIPTVTNGGMIAGKDEINAGKTSITIAPASDQVKYVLTDENGTVVDTKNAGDGKVVFDDLDPSKKYKVYTIPAGEQSPSGNVTVPETAVNIKTPSLTTVESATAGKTDEAENVTFDKTTTSITVKPTETGKEYAVIDPATGLVVGEWKPGTDTTSDGAVTALIFNGLSSDKEYTVVVRDAAAGGDEASLPVSLGTVKTNRSSSGSSGKGNSSSTNSGSINVTKPDHGTISVKPTEPSAGDKVTITVTPDPGYELDKLTVKDKNGKEIKLTDEGNGKYSYLQPAASAQPVDIKAIFVETAATGDPATNGVSKLLNVEEHNGYLNGYENGSFGPDQNMTRAEAAQMFYNLLNNKNVSGSKSFQDVSSSDWYCNAVTALANLGIVDGVGDGKYAPERNITRAEFVAIAMRFATNVTGEKTFTDVQRGHWAYSYITGATYYGWIGGYSDGSFRPDHSITRAEVAAVTNRMLARSADQKFIDANQNSVKSFSDVTSTNWAYYDILEAVNTHDYDRSENGTESWKN